jgi:Fe-S-cluster formation regulator IscX/YfhJ
MDDVENVSEQSLDHQAELALSEQTAEVVETNSINEQVPVQQKEEPVFDIDGEQVKLSDIKSWKSGHLMQADYTRKSQELAKERDGLKPYQELGDFIQKNPAFGQVLGKVAQEYVQKGPEALQNYLPEIDPREVKVQQLESTLHSLIVDSSREKSNQRLDAIRNDPKYGGIFKDKEAEDLLLAKALQTGDLELKKTADSIHKFFVGKIADAKLQTQKQVQLNKAAPTRKGTTGIPVMEIPSVDRSRMTSRELDRQALDMLS